MSVFHPQFVGASYVLAVQDLAKAVEYYQSQLGFETTWIVDGWHALKRGSFRVMLGECPDDRSAFETRNHSYFAYIDVDRIEALYQEYKEKEIEFIKELKDEPWGQKEFGIRTIDGHRIMFGEAITSLKDQS